MTLHHTGSFQTVIAIVIFGNKKHRKYEVHSQQKNKHSSTIYSPRIWENFYKIPPIPSTHISPETINSAIATNYVVNYVYFKSQSYIFCNEGSTHMHYTIEYNYMRAIACSR